MSSLMDYIHRNADRADNWSSEGLSGADFREILAMEARIAKLRAALNGIANSTWVAQTCPEAAQIARKAREEDDKHGMATD